MSDDNHKNGKGDVPRNCFSKDFKNNYDSINWHREEVFSILYAPVGKPMIEILRVCAESEVEARKTGEKIVVEKGLGSIDYLIVVKVN